MTLPYSTATSGDKALAEIQRILQKFGCNKFGVMTDWSAKDMRPNAIIQGSARSDDPAGMEG